MYTGRPGEFLKKIKRLKARPWHLMCRGLLEGGKFEKKLHGRKMFSRNRKRNLTESERKKRIPGKESKKRIHKPSISESS